MHADFLFPLHFLPDGLVTVFLEKSSSVESVEKLTSVNESGFWGLLELGCSACLSDTLISLCLVFSLETLNFLADFVLLFLKPLFLKTNDVKHKYDQLIFDKGVKEMECRNIILFNR